MSNIPTETHQDLVSSMELADWIRRTDPKARLGFYVYAPYPGTALFEEAKQQGMKMPDTIEEWGRMSLSNDRNVIAENLYYISGLNFRGDVSKKKFPGLYRLQILPFEILAKIRWKCRFLSFFGLEKMLVKYFQTALMRLNAQRARMTLPRAIREWPTNRSLLMIKRKIAVVTGSRSEYDIIYSTMKAIRDSKKLSLQVFATGTHLADRFGQTYREIEKDGFRIARKVISLLGTDTLLGRAKSIGIQIMDLRRRLTV